MQVDKSRIKKWSIISNKCFLFIIDVEVHFELSVHILVFTEIVAKGQKSNQQACYFHIKHFQLVIEIIFLDEQDHLIKDPNTFDSFVIGFHYSYELVMRDLFRFYFSIN